MGLLIDNEKARWAVIPRPGGARDGLVLERRDALDDDRRRSRRGGHIWFIPVWIIAGLVAVFAALARFGVV